MAVVILKNGREGDCQMFILGFCSDSNLGDRTYPDDLHFMEITYPSVSPGPPPPPQPCVLFQQLVASGTCLVSINGLTTGDNLIVPLASGGTIAIPMNVGGVAIEYIGSHPVFTKFVGVAVDVTLCNGNGYWTRGPSNAQIDLPGSVIMYHELIGHALHYCNNTYNASDPEGQAIGDENVLRTLQGLPQRTSHEGGCGGGGGGCFIASAAYRSKIAPEVHELRQFRDRVLRSTQWGDRFFEECWGYYYSFSPYIAAKMDGDPRMTELVRSALVHPWIIALRLFLSLPANSDDPNDAVDFVKRAADEFALWIEQLPLGRLAPIEDSWSLANEMLLPLVIAKNHKLREALFDCLSRSGILPVVLPEEKRVELERKFEQNGVSYEDIQRIFTFKG